MHQDDKIQICIKRIVPTQKHKFPQMFLTAILIILGICWLGIGWWGYTNAKSAFTKYSKYSKFYNLNQKYFALYRDDYQQWNQKWLKIGCFTLLPFRFLAFISLVIGGVFLAFLIKTFGEQIILINLFNFYLNSYGRLIIRIHCQISQQYDHTLNPISPIIISNHLTWFDILYFMTGYSPISFLSKQQVKNWPAIGIIATAIQSIYVKRQSQQAKKQVKQLIKSRIQRINNHQPHVSPLLIFPEGTTSNGKGLLTFKMGAFEHLSNITAYCIKYQCSNFNMGMSEITQVQHIIMMLSSFPKIIVKRHIFTPNLGENPDQYKNRCQTTMAQILGIPCTKGGFRQKIELNNLRKKNV